jgi:hypothetical protein
VAPNGLGEVVVVVSRWVKRCAQKSTSEESIATALGIATPPPLSVSGSVDYCATVWV